MSWKDNPIMYWNEEKVSDHGRSELSITTERIERRERMIDGTMRRYLVTTKSTFSTTWENLPSAQNARSGPVDAGMTGPEIKAFLDDTTDPFTLTLSNGAGESEQYTVYLQDFSYEIVKRGPTVDLWSVDLTLVEV